LLSSLVASAPALASSIQVGGTDAETQYTYDGNTDTGILTFYDAFNGFNLPENGVVTSSVQVPGLIGKDVMFEVMLDTSSFNATTGDVRDARFIGTGAGPELTIWDGATLLLALDVNFIEVSNAFRAGGIVGGADGTIQMGAFDAQTYGVASALTVVGGTLNAAVGGIGTGAVMEVLMSSLNPPMTKALLQSGYLGTNFSNGVGSTGVSTTWNLAFVPEPQTVVLLAAAALGALGAARRLRAPR
jgi:hypothetical protein